MPPMNPLLVSKAVDRGFISKAVDRGFIGGVMISVLVSKAVDHGLMGGGLMFLSRNARAPSLGSVGGKLF
jgi:hypothetical protein